jgi:hypothetical protein
MGAMSLTVATLAKHGLGMDVEDNPRSSDFMKPKSGNTRYDTMGGFQQYITLAARLVSGETKTLKGDVKELDGKGINDSRRDVSIRFLLNKLAPIPSLASDALEGKTPTGEEFTWKDGIASRAFPMIVGDLKEAFDELGAEGVLINTPLIAHGVGVQTYAPREEKGDKGFSSKEDLIKEFAKDFEKDSEEMAPKDMEEWFNE